MPKQWWLQKPYADGAIGELLAMDPTQPVYGDGEKFDTFGGLAGYPHSGGRQSPMVT